MRLEAGDERVHAVLGAREPRQRDRRHPLGQRQVLLALERAHSPQHLITVLVRQADIADHKIRPAVACCVSQVLERGPAVVERHDRRAARLEQRAQGLSRILVVVDDEQVLSGQRDRVRRDVPCGARRIGLRGDRPHRQRGRVGGARRAVLDVEPAMVLVENSGQRVEIDRTSGPVLLGDAKPDLVRHALETDLDSRTRYADLERISDSSVLSGRR